MKNYIISILVLTAFFVGVYFLQNKIVGSKQESSAPKNLANLALSTDAKNPIVVMKTNFGEIKLEFFEKDAPKTVANFIKLAKEGFYNDTKFHRVIPDFMIQGGDPNTKDNDWSNDGQGGPGYKFEDEINSNKLVKGSLAMANSGPNTNGSQFFIVTAESTPWLDGKHTVFGKVLEGMDAVTKIEHLDKNENNHPLQDAVIQGIEFLEKAN